MKTMKIMQAHYDVTVKSNKKSKKKLCQTKNGNDKNSGR